MYNNKNVNI